MPGYVLVNMELNEDSWGVLLKGTPGVTGFVGAAQEPVPLTQVEVDRLLHKEVATAPRTRAQFAIGETVKVVSGPLSDFPGEISEHQRRRRQAQGPGINLRPGDPRRGGLRPGQKARRTGSALPCAPTPRATGACAPLRTTAHAARGQQRYKKHYSRYSFTTWPRRF